MITRSCIEKIKNAVDVYDVVSPYVALKRCGANWRGLSPFNPEKTPSFFVMPAKRMFRCFSSGNAGDIFRFVQLQEKVTFAEAVEIIANRFNLPIEYEKSNNSVKQQYSRKSLYDINAFAHKMFIKQFWANTTEAQKLRNYWEKERNFSLDVAKKYEIGYAGCDSKILIQSMLDAGFGQDAIKACGIFYYKDDEKDVTRGILRFRNRMIIPIHDIQCRVVGFSSRFIKDVTPDDSFLDAKYINSPETDIFHKGNLLFGLYHARQYVDEESALWLVEGQFDVIRCWECGINTAIAPQGTAITDTQLNMIRRYTTHINCSLDGDSAGQKAALRILPMAMIAGLDITFFILPAGQDPDSFFSQDFHNRFADIQKYGMSSIKFLVSQLLNKKSALSAQEKAATMTNIYEVIAASESSIARESYLDELSIVAGFDRHAIGEDFKSFLTKRKFTTTPTIWPQKNGKQPSSKINSAASQLLSVCLLNNTIARSVAEFIDMPFLQQLNCQAGQLLLKILNEVREGMWDGMLSFDNTSLFSDEEKNLAYTLISEVDEEIDAINVANLCIKKLHIDSVKREINAIDEKFRKISLDEVDTIRTLQNRRMDLRAMLRQHPQILQ